MKIAGIIIADAWDMRRVARKLYPGQVSLQIKWLRAWRFAPGPRVPIGARTQAEKIANTQ